MEWSEATIENDGFSMVLGQTTIGNDGFSMVGHYRSNDGMVTYHRRSLTVYFGLRIVFTENFNIAFPAVLFCFWHKNAQIYHNLLLKKYLLQNIDSFSSLKRSQAVFVQKLAHTYLF